MKLKNYNFFELLCCPSCRGDLSYSDDTKELRCPFCNCNYPTIEGIPVLFPLNAKEKMSDMLYRYWDSCEKAKMYDAHVEGKNENDIFGVYNNKSEIYGIVQFYDPKNLDIVLDAGCGNGRFFKTFPDNSIKIGADASLNMLLISKGKKQGDFFVCCELENLPFKDYTFSTVISCRVLQHIKEQENAIKEMIRVTRNHGHVILEVYNKWNVKTIYKNIRMSPKLSRIFNAPFKLLFNSMSPFASWGIEYDRYNSYIEINRMFNSSISSVECRGMGFGYHKYLFQPFYINSLMQDKIPNILSSYYNGCFKVEKVVGSLFPFKYFMEKLIINAVKK